MTPTLDHPVSSELPSCHIKTSLRSRFTAQVFVIYAPPSSPVSATLPDPKNLSLAVRFAFFLLLPYISPLSFSPFPRLPASQCNNTTGLLPLALLISPAQSPVLIKNMSLDTTTMSSTPPLAHADIHTTTPPIPTLSKADFLERDSIGSPNPPAEELT